MKKYIFFVGGKTGGHLIPGIQLALQLKKNNIEPFFLCYDSPLDRLLLQKEGFSFRALKSAPPNQILKCLLLGIYSTFISLYYILKLSPSCVIGLGGFASFWGLLSGFILRKKTMILEQNRRFGLANKVLSQITPVCLCSLPLSYQDKRQYKGKVYLLEPFSQSICPPKKAPTSQKVIGITGGSQGSSFLNQTLYFIVRSLNNPDYRFILLTGKKDYNQCLIRYQNEPSVQLIDFCQDMPSFYQSIDCVISRSGSGSLNDILKYEVPSLLIPYPYAGAHQRDNALLFDHFGMAFLMDESEGKEKLLEFFQTLFCPQVQTKLTHNIRKYKKRFKGHAFSDIFKKEVE